MEEEGGGGGNRGRVSKRGRLPICIYVSRDVDARDGDRAMMIFSRWIEIEDAIGREGCRRWDWHLLPSTSLLPFRTSVLPNYYSTQPTFCPTSSPLRISTLFDLPPVR